MTIYCDQLRTGAAIVAVGLFRAERDRPHRLVVLDPIAAGPWSRLLDLALRTCGVTVEEAVFFAGHLRAADGETVYRAARKQSMSLAFRAAKEGLEVHPLLSGLNQKYGRETLRLFLARRVWPSLEDWLRRIHVARALDGHASADTRVMLRHPDRFDARLLTGAVPGTLIHYYWSSNRWLVKWGSIGSGLLTAVRSAFARRAAPSLSGTFAEAGPTLLTLQEDDLGLDRSYRTQPHWLSTEAPAPFRTLVWQNRYAARLPVDHAALSRAGIEALGEEQVQALARRDPRTALEARLAADARTCLWAAVRAGDSAESFLLSSSWKLLRRAQTAAALCRARHVRAFLASENSMLDADAVNMVAPALGVRTLSCQYSNISLVSPLLMTTADVMAVFSPLYERVFVHDGIGPATLKPVGYPFDSSFALVRQRAAAARATLRAAGARFVVCYLDESVQAERYGQIAEEDHRHELVSLMRLVLADPAMALVVKAQFRTNSPSQRYASQPELAEVRRTGRYVELCEGLHRNVVFPAEAALMSDLVIGHAFGATAPLEATLAGARAVLLNPYTCRGAWDDLYARADIVYPSIEAVIEAIGRHRAGDVSAAALGDWTPILANFDTYRDGRSAARLRTLIEESVTGGTVSSRDHVRLAQVG